jgi:hypothetical protein
MSYDVYLFQLNNKVNAEQINDFLETDAYQQYIDECYEQEESEAEGEEESEEDMPPIPARFINNRLAEEDLQRMIFKAWLKLQTSEDARSPETREYLASDTAEVPEEWMEYYECMFEYDGAPGMQPMMFSYGGDLAGSLEEVAGILEALQAERIAAFDPQLDKVVTGDTARAMLLESGKEAQGEFNAIFHTIQTEGVEPGNADEENEDDEDEK